ncbi:hypothetical protein Hypma_014594 [Hypsizygus marmoreus]|uniref:Uncharacterized protein n=1 Tax=Hypsizygus marmoreus TaxID=39966 RepID=A0A369JC54_HYPMA|nr:hypothetical protein Hypma_014594 [Hypsizygus marmoreus]
MSCCQWFIANVGRTAGYTRWWALHSSVDEAQGALSRLRAGGRYIGHRAEYPVQLPTELDRGLRFDVQNEELEEVYAGKADDITMSEEASEPEEDEPSKPRTGNILDARDSSEGRSTESATAATPTRCILAPKEDSECSRKPGRFTLVPAR